jgi:hypothetical protein
MISETYNELSDRIRTFDGVFKTKTASYTNLKKEVEDLDKERDLLTKTGKLINFLIDKLAKQDLSKMDQIITYGLSTVFPKRDIEFKSSLEERGKKLWINLDTYYDGNLVDPDNKSSVSVIESFLLRILCIIKLKKANILLLDETFAAVGAENIDDTSSLLSEMSKKLGLDILLVTHNPGGNQWANQCFQARLKNKCLEVERTK